MSFLSEMICYCFGFLLKISSGTAKKMGDDTAEMMGLMTLNPIDHIDMIGLVFLLFFYFGWGKYVPINPFNIQDPHRKIKLIATYLSDSFAYLPLI